MHEVHRPHVVDRFRHSKRFRPLPIQALLRLNPQIERQFAIDPVNSLVVPTKASDVTQIQKAQFEAPVALTLRQSHQPISILITQLRPIAIAVLADRESRARSPNIEPTRSDSRFGHLSTLGRLHRFFAMASLITSF